MTASDCRQLRSFMLQSKWSPGVLDEKEAAALRSLPFFESRPPAGQESTYFHALPSLGPPFVLAPSDLSLDPSLVPPRVLLLSSATEERCVEQWLGVRRWSTQEMMETLLEASEGEGRPPSPAFVDLGVQLARKLKSGSLPDEIKAAMG